MKDSFDIHKNDVLIEKITCPKLNQVEFASDLEQAFININNNFAKLANHDFIKGGDSSLVEIRSVPIYKNEKEFENTLCEDLYNYINNLLGDQERYVKENNVVLDYFDNFKYETAGSIHLIYGADEDSVIKEKIPYSSLQYVFLDGRFWNNSVGKINSSKFNGLKDMSCVIMYDKNEGFKSLSNSIPTIYYDANIGLCWNINGNKTGISVQGVPGKDGMSSLIRIVKVESLKDISGTTMKTGDAVSIFDENLGSINLKDNTSINIDKYDKSTALVVDTSTSNMYFGYTEITSENENYQSIPKKLIVKCETSVSLNSSIASNNILELLKNTVLLPNDYNLNSLRGLFIPINYNENPNVHFTSSTPSFNDIGKPYTDIIVAPIKNVDSLNNYDGESLIVDKYLYVKLDERSNIFNNDEIKDALSKYNYCLKYKLIDEVINLSDDKLKPTLNNFIAINTYQDGKVGLSTSNVKYLRLTENGNYATTENYMNSISNDFNKNHLYMWEIQYDVNENIDVNELLKTNASNYSDVPKCFKYIFTDSISPNISTNILWFNALETIKINGTDKEFNKYIIPGWCKTTDIFTILKFIPIYKDSKFNLLENSTINLNYNVNITGNDSVNSSTKRNLTVNGDIMCDNIDISGKVKLNEIDVNIISNDIVGKGGISLANYKYNNNGTELEDYRFKLNSNNADINSTGNLTAKNLFVNSINGSELNTTNDLATSRISTNNLNIVGKGVTDKVDVEICSNDNTIYDDRLQIDVNDIRGINIKKRRVLDTNLDTNSLLNDSDSSDEIKKYEQELKGNVSKISTDTSIIAYDKSAIVVTDNSPENVFIDENITKSLCNYFKTNDVDVNELVNTPNKYEIVKNVFSNDLLTNSNKCTQIEVLNILSNTDIYTEIYNTNVNIGKIQNFIFTKDHSKLPLDKLSIAKFNIIKSSNNALFNIGNGIKLILPKFQFLFGLQSLIENGNYTLLKDMKINLKCSIHRLINNEPLLISIIDCGNYTLNENNIVWNKYNAPYDEKGNLKDSEEINEEWRYSAFVVNPNVVNISNRKILNDIFNSYNGNETLVFNVYPEFEVYIGSENETMLLAKNCKILSFSNIGKSNRCKYISNDNFINNVKSDIYSKLLYTEEDKFEKSISSTMICKDGILIKSNNHLFGMGMGNHNGELVPELCYSSYDKNTNTPISKSISISDLFAKLS